VSPVKAWQRYEESVAAIAGDLMMALTGSGKRVRIEKNVLLKGANGLDHRADVLATAGSEALFIECKHFVRKPIQASHVFETVPKFLNACSARPSMRWRLVMVASQDIRRKVQTAATHFPAAPIAANLAGGTLRASAHFVYFNPPRDPFSPSPLFVVDDGGVSPYRTGVERISEFNEEREWDQLRDLRAPLALRVSAGLCLFGHRSGALLASPGASRTLVHGLMHLGRVQEAMYVRRLTGPPRANDASLEIEDHMMRFNLANSYGARAARPGWKQIQALRRMVGAGSLRDDVSVRSFIGPVIARLGDEEEGRRLLAGVRPRAGALDTEDAPYYELLRLVRSAQVSKTPTEREELLEAGRSVLGELPVWNRHMGGALVRATEAHPQTMYGLDVPFDVEEWSGVAAPA
jgi:hypothetical protein